MEVVAFWEAGKRIWKEATLFCALSARALPRGGYSSCYWQKEGRLQIYTHNASTFSPSEFRPKFFHLFMNSHVLWFHNHQ